MKPVTGYISKINIEVLLGGAGNYPIAMWNRPTRKITMTGIA
jgi:hypothetical protein